MTVVVSFVFEYVVWYPRYTSLTCLRSLIFFNMHRIRSQGSLPVHKIRPYHSCTQTASLAANVIYNWFQDIAPLLARHLADLVYIDAHTATFAPTTIISILRSPFLFISCTCSMELSSPNVNILKRLKDSSLLEHSKAYIFYTLHNTWLYRVKW